MATFFSGFVCDEDCEILQSSIPRRFGLATLTEIGISKGAPDGAVIRHARARGFIIITKNEVDYEQAMRVAPAFCNGQDCRCGAGLITVSNSLNRIPFETITRNMTLGAITVDWDDVFQSNLQVSVRRDESFEVTRLPLCRWELALRTGRPSCERIDDALPLAPFE